MADRTAVTAAAHGRRRRESFAERRERRAAVDDPAVVLEAAARFLEVRSRSVAEVRRRLTSNGYRPDLVDGAITRMTELGMLDDEAFARAWVESRDRSRPRGERAIRVELGQKGVDRAVIDDVLAARRAGGLAFDDPDRPVDPDEPPVSADRSAAERLDGQARAVARSRRRSAPAPGAGVRAAGPQRLRSRDVPRGRGHGHRDRRRGRGRRGRSRRAASRSVYQRETRYSASAKTPSRFAEALLCCQSSPMNVRPGTSLTPGRGADARPRRGSAGRASRSRGHSRVVQRTVADALAREVELG